MTHVLLDWSGGWLGAAHLAATLASAPAPAGGGGGGGGGAGQAPFWVQLFASPFFPLVLGLLVLYFIVFRQKRKQDRERQQMLDAVKKGDAVETIGGLFGTVLHADDNTVTLKVDESANVKLKFARRAIHRVIPEDDKSSK